MGKYDDKLAVGEGFLEDYDDFDDEFEASDESGICFSCEFKKKGRVNNRRSDDKYCQSDDEGGGYI